MASGKVLYGSREGVHILRFVGKVGYTLGPTLQRFVDRLFASSPPLGFVVDLRETSHIDSTNLGLLAKIANRMRERGSARVTLVSNREDINEILYTVGFDAVFDIVEGSEISTDQSEPLPTIDSDNARLRRTMLEAHRTLMELNDQNRREFADVVSLLEQQTAEPAGHGTR